MRSAARQAKAALRLPRYTTAWRQLHQHGEERRPAEQQAPALFYTAAAGCQAQDTHYCVKSFVQVTGMIMFL